jgi:hypothetical protein
MSRDVIARRLRPYLFTSYHKRVSATSGSYRHFTQGHRRYDSKAAGREATNDYERRVKQLEVRSPASRWWPRWHGGQTVLQTFREEHEGLKNAETAHEVECVAGASRTIQWWPT